jgi:cell division protein ZapA (FtsZ GTPase activity inhibitor)
MLRKDEPMSERPEPSSVRVRIYDREFALRTTGDPERLRALCDSLDKRMREVAASTGAVDTLKVAVLAALSLGDDLQRIQEELNRLDDSVGRRSLACVSLLDRLFP